MYAERDITPYALVEKNISRILTNGFKGTFHSNVQNGHFEIPKGNYERDLYVAHGWNLGRGVIYLNSVSVILLNTENNLLYTVTAFSKNFLPSSCFIFMLLVIRCYINFE